MIEFVNLLKLIDHEGEINISHFFRCEMCINFAEMIEVVVWEFLKSWYPKRLRELSNALMDYDHLSLVEPKVE